MTPTDRKYSKHHQWIKEDGTVGITDHAQKMLNNIVFVNLPEKGINVKQEEKLATIESVKSVSDIFAPASGEITEINKELKSNPEVINDDPYEKGWIAKINIKDKSELDKLMSSEEYDDSVK